jgi:membrane protein implicated in regulation of membrane protease activity
MELIGLIAGFGGWSWIVAGAVLLAIELMVPGGVFVWLGVSAIVVGLASLVQSIPWQWQWALFALLSIATVAGWIGYVRRRPEATDSPFLNVRTRRFVGRTYTLDEPIENGDGRLRIGDTTWRVSGEDAAVGTRVTVVGADGSVLRVEPASDDASGA